MKSKKKTVLINRARKQKLMKNLYYGLQLPLIEGMISVNYDLKNNKYY